MNYTEEMDNMQALEKILKEITRGFGGGSIESSIKVSGGKE